MTFIKFFLPFDQKRFRYRYHMTESPQTAVILKVLYVILQPRYKRIDIHLKLAQFCLASTNETQLSVLNKRLYFL